MCVCYVCCIRFHWSIFFLLPFLLPYLFIVPKLFSILPFLLSSSRPSIHLSQTAMCASLKWYVLQCGIHSFNRIKLRRSPYSPRTHSKCISIHIVVGINQRIVWCPRASNCMCVFSVESRDGARRQMLNFNFLISVRVDGAAGNTANGKTKTKQQNIKIEITKSECDGRERKRIRKKKWSLIRLNWDTVTYRWTVRGCSTYCTHLLNCKRINGERCVCCLRVGERRREGVEKIFEHTHTEGRERGRKYLLKWLPRNSFSISFSVYAVQSTSTGIVEFV